MPSFMIFNNYAVKCYKCTNPIREMIFLRSLISLRNGFVLATNIYGFQFLKELDQISSKGFTVAFTNPRFFWDTLYMRKKS